VPRFFHLADLHLGRVFHGESLLEDQSHILELVVNQVKAERPDAVILAGDLFDRAVPPAGAMGSSG
jgi:exonuclease SbcD